MFKLFRKKITDAVRKISKKVASEEKPEKPKKVKKKPVKKAQKKPEIKETRPEVKESPEKEKAGLIEKLKAKVTKKELSEGFLDEALWELEIALLENNVASEVSQKIVSGIKEDLKGQSVSRKKAEEIINSSMKRTIKKILSREKIDVAGIVKKCKKDKRPALIMVLGFNGSGKTTNLAKLAKYLQGKKFSVVFAAADTFRVASIEQLEEHANNLGVRVIKQKYGADPAAVIFDAVKHAQSKKIEVVLADTAGRVHTDSNLVDELKKIIRVNNPDLKLLVVEAIAGNDVVEQAKIFGEAGVDGVILSKWDIDEKGGAALSVTHTLDKPIVFLGTGQEYRDLEEFDAEKVIKSIF